MMFSISGVMFLFGLTWLFAVLLFTGIELRNISQLLFTIFNSLQGFFIFVFILNIEAVGLWKKLLACGSKPSKSRSTVSTQKKIMTHSNSQSGCISTTKRTSETQLIQNSEQGFLAMTIKETVNVIIESEVEDSSAFSQDQVKKDLSL